MQPEPIAPRRLAHATLAASVIAALVLVVAILPAEYGIDPTGIGEAAGFKKLSGAHGTPLIETVPEATSSSLYEFRAVWRLDALRLAEKKGEVARGATDEEVTIRLEVLNLTSVTATLTWDQGPRANGAPADGTTLGLSARSPDGQRSHAARSTNAPGEPGNVSVTLNLRSVPFPSETSEAVSIDKAEDRSGVGDWTFTVGSYGADPGTTWTLTINGEAYELDLKKRAERLGDRVRITLAPNMGVEYKFGMEGGANMTYRWTAEAPVHADLHGDRAEDPQNFVSAKIATLSEDEGTYTAPFSGRHGWYWRNDGATPVTITLESTGAYRIIGVT